MSTKQFDKYPEQENVPAPDHIADPGKMVAAAPAMVSVPLDLIERLPELNPLNYNDDDAVALNDWAIHVWQAAHPVAAAQQNAKVHQDISHDPPAMLDYQSTAPYEPPLVYDSQQGQMEAPGFNIADKLRKLFDKTAAAHEGEYKTKVTAALIAVYDYGRRRAVAPQNAAAQEGSKDPDGQVEMPSVSSLPPVSAATNAAGREAGSPGLEDYGLTGSSGPAASSVIITRNQANEAIAVTRKDAKGRVLEVLWERPDGNVEQDARRHQYAREHLFVGEVWNDNTEAWSDEMIDSAVAKQHDWHRANSSEPQGMQTPRTDAAADRLLNGYVGIAFARQLEIEFQAAQAKLAECEQEKSTWIQRADKTWHAKNYTDQIDKLTAKLAAAESERNKWEYDAHCYAAEKEAAEERRKADLLKARKLMRDWQQHSSPLSAFDTTFPDVFEEKGNG